MAKKKLNEGTIKPGGKPSTKKGGKKWAIKNKTKGSLTATQLNDVYNFAFLYKIFKVIINYI